MTPEIIAEKAAKYNMLPEDYYPMSMKAWFYRSSWKIQNHYAFKKSRQNMIITK